ncbi:MAG: hypothetical protein ACRDD1_18990, partial [Planctomycetia bacterium]
GELRDVVHRTVRRVTVSTVEPGVRAAVQADGDPAGFAPAHITVLRRAAAFLTPPNGRLQD